MDEFTIYSGFIWLHGILRQKSWILGPRKLFRQKVNTYAPIGGASEEVRNLTSRLKKILDEDKPAKLSIAEGAKKIKPKNGSINVTHFSLDDVYTIKIGNTSFTSVVCGDVKNHEKKDVLTIEQRCDILKEIGPSNELPKKLEETVVQPTVNQNSANRTEVSQLKIQRDLSGSTHVPIGY